MANSSYNKKNYNRKNQKSNKGLFIGIGSILVICIALLIAIPLLEGKHPVYGVAKSKLNSATQAILNDPNYANTISDETLDKKVENKEDFFLYMYAATCPYCLATTPDLMKLADDLSVHIDQFNLLEFKSYQQKYNIEYTPTLVYFEDGVEKERIVGGLSEDSSAGNTIEDYKAFFERHQGE